MEQRKIKAVFFDIDGTLRDNESKRVPDSAKAALERARKAGLFLFVATGRHKLEIEEEKLLEDIRFDGYVTMNGQYCYCNNQVVFDAPIADQCVKDMLRLLKEEPFPCLFMEEDRLYINMINDMVVKSQNGIGTRLPPVLDVRRAAGRRIYQMVPYVNPEKEGFLKERLTGCEWIRWHDDHAVDLIPRGGGKSVGMEHMAARFGIGLSGTAAVGDGHNDVSMLKAARLGIAMGNAGEEVKNAADYITGSVKTHGIEGAIGYILAYNSGLNEIIDDRRKEG